MNILTDPMWSDRCSRYRRSISFISATTGRTSRVEVLRRALVPGVRFEILEPGGTMQL